MVAEIMGTRKLYPKSLKKLQRKVLSDLTLTVGIKAACVWYRMKIWMMINKYMKFQVIPKI